MKTLLGAAVLLGAATVCGTSAAATPTVADVLANSGIKVTGDLAGSYTAGFDDGQTLNYRPFNKNSNSFIFNQALVTISHAPKDGFGGVARLIAGTDAQTVNALYGSGSSDFALHLAYLQYAHDGFKVIAGRYISLAGPERIVDPVDSNISRSLLFTLAQPRVETGVRASYAPIREVRLFVGVSNDVRTPALAALGGPVKVGVASDTNKQKVVETGIAFTPTAALDGALRDYYSHQDNVGFNYLDFVTTYKATRKLKFVVNADWFHAHTHSGSADLYGVAAYADYQVAAMWVASLRGEILRSKNIGFRPAHPVTAKRATLSEVTATLGYTPVRNFMVRGELRYDLGDTRNAVVLNGDGIPRAAVGNVAVQAIYSF